MSSRGDMHRGGYDMELMVKMRIEGMNYADLGRFFNRDRTTVMYHCKKLGIKVKAPIPKKSAVILTEIRIETELQQARMELIESPLKPSKYEHLLNEKMNRGKRYSEYVAESLKRTIERKYHSTYHENTNLSTILTKRNPTRDPRVGSSTADAVAEFAAEEAEERGGDHEEDPPVV